MGARVGIETTPDNTVDVEAGTRGISKQHSGHTLGERGAAFSFDPRTLAALDLKGSTSKEADAASQSPSARLGHVTAAVAAMSMMELSLPADEEVRTAAQIAADARRDAWKRWLESTPVEVFTMSITILALFLADFAQLAVPSRCGC